MLKFLRKYNKFILVVGGSLLMVAFLLQGTLSQCQGDPRNITYAKLGEQTISLYDANRASAEIQALERLVPVATQFLDPNRKVDHWLLLTHEASRAGLVGDAQDGAGWIPELARRMAEATVLAGYQQFGPEFRRQLLSVPAIRQQVERQVPDLERLIVQRRGQVAAASGLREQAFDRALARARGVWRLLRAYQEAARVSDVRARRYADREQDLAFASVAFVPAAAVLDEVETPGKDALRAHFERFREIPPDGGEYGIGYLFPPRVKLEWLVLDREALGSRLELDPIEVRKHYARNRGDFPGEFDAARARVERALRERIVDEIMSVAGNAVQARVQEAMGSLEADGRFKVLPEDWADRMPRMEDIARAVVSRVEEALTDVPIRDPGSGVRIPLPEVNVRDAGWLTQEELAELPGPGSAAYRSGTIRIPFPEAVMSVRELGGGFPIPFQVGVPLANAPFVDTRGSRYYVTILDAREESPPDSFEEIAERVREDARRLAAYELLASRAEELRSLAVSGGPEAVVRHFAPAGGVGEDISTIERAPTEIPDEVEGQADDPQSEAGREGAPEGGAAEEQDGGESPVILRERVEVLRRRVVPAFPEVDREAFRERVLELAGGLDPLVPVAEQPAEARTLSVALPRSLGLAIAQIVGLRPTTIEQVRQTIDNYAPAYVASEFAEAAGSQSLAFAGPFAYDALRERLNYQPVRSRGTVDPVAGDEPAEDEEEEEADVGDQPGPAPAG